MKLDFDREEYLEYAEQFEKEGIEDCDKELCEFSNDIKAIAFELAYTRYALAKMEKDAQNETEVDEEGYTIIRNYQKLSPKKRDKYKIIDCEVDIVDQSGGYCRGYGNAILNSKNQSDGHCRGYGNAIINSENQSGGFCRGFDNTIINSHSQSGGDCRSFDNTIINSHSQSGGYCKAYNNATLKVTNHIDGEYGVDCTAILNDIKEVKNDYEKI